MEDYNVRNYKNIEHPFEPIYDSNSRILILGTIPSIKSRENGFYYGNPHNTFWKIISDLYAEKQPITIEDKKGLLLRHTEQENDLYAEILLEMINSIEESNDMKK